MKRLLPTSLLAGALVLGLSTPALAGNPTPPPPPLPADQVVLSGTCLPVSVILAAAELALSVYAPGDQPAGVIVNGNWVPAGIAASDPVAYAVYGGCPPTPTPTTVAPVPSPTTTQAPTPTSTDPVTSSTTVPSTTTTAAPTTTTVQVTTTTARRCHRR